MTEFSNVVNATWLQQAVADKTVKVIDGSWYLPAQKRNARTEFAEMHIPGAVYFDLDEISDTTSPFPHMLPDAATFANRVAELGISNSDHVVVYDGLGLFSAPRIWWMFKVFGHDKVSVLNGGLPAWLADGGITEAGPPSITPGKYSAVLNVDMVANWDDVVGMIDGTIEPDGQILDARAPDRFKGFAPEPRAGLKAGHMPGALNLPFSSVLDDNNQLRPANELRDILQEHGLDLAKPVTTSCGSGVTAAVLSLALAEAGATSTRLYDGSWAEWGQRKETAELIERG